MATRPENSNLLRALTPNEAIMGSYDAIVEGPTVEACLKRAATLLAVSQHKLDHIVLERGIQHLLGSVNIPFRCRTYRRGDPAPALAPAESAPPVAVAGGPVVVGMPQAAKVRVNKSEDRMLATLAVTPPAAGGAEVSLEQLREALLRAGVTTGIDQAKLAAIVEQKLYYDVHAVAQGIPGRPSRDARIDFKVQLERKAAPVIDEHGHADFHETNLIESVAAGQVLAVKQPKDEGLPGQDVGGAMQDPHPTKDIALNAGKNVVLLDDGLTYTAAIDGQVKYKAGTLSVEPVLEIGGDVDFHTGNICFLGTVIVRGSVLDNFTVRASQDIIVNGTVNMAQVEAEGNVQVRGGIIGNGAGTVSAGGNITAKFVENARLHAGRHVVVTEAILHSQVDAGHTVALTGKKAVIVGGRCRAGHAVYAKEIGSDAGTPTVVEVGLQLRMRDRVKQAEDELARQILLLNKVVLGLKGLLKIKAATGQLPADREQMLQELHRVGARLKEKVALLGVEIDTLRGELAASGTEGKVAVLVRVNPRVQLTIGRAVLLVTQPLEFTTVRCALGEIALSPYEKPNLKKLLAGQKGNDMDDDNDDDSPASGGPAKSGSSAPGKP